MFSTLFDIHPSNITYFFRIVFRRSLKKMYLNKVIYFQRADFSARESSQKTGTTLPQRIKMPTPN